MNMVCVKSIELVEVDRDRIEFANFPPPDVRFQPEELLPVKDIGITREMIKGKVFRNSLGRKVCIGMRKEVQDALGLPFEAFDDLRDQVEQKNLIVKDLLEQINAIKNMGFWARFRRLFFSYS